MKIELETAKIVSLDNMDRFVERFGHKLDLDQQLRALRLYEALHPVNDLAIRIGPVRIPILDAKKHQFKRKNP